MYPHRIHLHGPWDCEPLARTVLLPDGRIEAVSGPVPAAARMTIPCRWAEGGLGPFNGRARFRRRFHWPGRLDYYERLWLVFWGADYFARVWLNGEELGEHEGAFDPFEFDITQRVRSRNELLVEVDLPALSPDRGERMFRHVLPEDNGGLWGEVGLEVRREAFLKSVFLRATFDGPEPELHVSGRIVPDAAGPKELYLLLDGATVLYQQAGCGRFELSVPTPGVQRWWPQGLSALGEPSLYEVRIDLVEGATKLDSQAFAFGFRQVAYDAESNSLLVNGHELPAEHQPRFLHIDRPLEHIDLTEENRLGRPLWLRGLATGIAPEERWQRELERQLKALTPLFSNPAVFGWREPSGAPRWAMVF